MAQIPTAEAQVCANWVRWRKSVVLLAPLIILDILPSLNPQAPCITCFYAVSHFVSANICANPLVSFCARALPDALAAGENAVKNPLGYERRFAKLRRDKTSKLVFHRLIMEEYILKLQKIIDNSNNVVFFGGAGVSTESGIPDFRSQDGLYAQKYKYPPEQIVSHTFFTRRTAEFFEFYRDKMLYPSAKPNPAHIYLSNLEKAGKLKAVITQNIDGLHQAAGSKNVLELHGSVLRNYCTRCGKFYPMEYIKKCKGVPQCSCGGVIKPDVVLYEESLDGDIINAAVKAISEAETLIIGGTSLVVYPAAGFIDFFRGKHLVVINKSPTSADSRAELVISEGIGKVFSALTAANRVQASQCRLTKISCGRALRFFVSVGGSAALAAIFKRPRNI